MKNFFLLIIFGWSCSIINAQTTLISLDGNTPFVPLKAKDYALTKASYGKNPNFGAKNYEQALALYEEMTGSPFLFGEPFSVDLLSVDGTIHANSIIRYDLYSNEIIAKSRKGNEVVLDKIYYKGFNHEEEGVEYLYRRVDPKNPLRFYKILFQNEDFIFCSDTKVTIRQNDQFVPGQESLKKEFIKRKEYFIVIDKVSTKVKLKKNAVVEYLPEKYQTQVGDLKKKFKLKKLNKEKDYLLLMKEWE